MIALEQLPSLVLHQIISYLPYEALLALRESCRFFLERVEDQVLEDLCLPLQSRNLSVITRVKSRPVLDLSVILRLRESEKCYVDSELETLRSQLNSLNLTKVGALTVKIEPEEDCRISWDYHARLETSSLVVCFNILIIQDLRLSTEDCTGVRPQDLQCPESGNTNRFSLRRVQILSHPTLKYSNLLSTETFDNQPPLQLQLYRRPLRPSDQAHLQNPVPGEL